MGWLRRALRREARSLGLDLLEWAIPAALCALLGLGYAYFFGAGPGEPCEESSDCAGLFSVCARKAPAQSADEPGGPEPTKGFCTTHCDEDRHCPAGWTCQEGRCTP